MRILQVISTFYPAWAFGGPVKVAYDISKELARRGHEVEVFTTNAYNQTSNFKPKFKTQKLSGFKVTYFNNLVRYGNVFVSPTMIAALSKRVKEFDVIHSHYGRQAHDVAVSFYAHKYGVPYVLQAHGSLPRIMDMQNLKLVFDSFIGYRLLKGASRVIALTQTEAQQYLNMGVHKENIEIIPNGLDLSEYANLPVVGSFRRKFNLDNDEKLVLYLGRINKIKGVDLLVRAFANIVEKLGNVKLVIAGPDDGYLSEVEALIKVLKITDKVLVIGPLYGKDKLAAYVDADVYVLPSRYEIFGMTVLESVACGTPVIISDACGVDDYFSDRVSIVVKTGSTFQLQEALLEMLVNQKRREIYKDNCKTALQMFNIYEIVLQLEKVYEGITSNRFKMNFSVGSN